MSENSGTEFWRCRNLLTEFLLIAALSVVVLGEPAKRARQQDMESIEAIISCLRVNAVEGDLVYEHEGAKYSLEPGFELKEGDLLRSVSRSRAELLLQPGNYLRVGEETECQILGDNYDRLKLKLNQGTISLELLRNEWEQSSNFLDSIQKGYELIRVITPNSEVFISQPGIFRINTTAQGRTEIIVRKGEALIDGRRVQEKSAALATKGTINIRDIDPKIEDAFDLWGRERADKLTQANRLLKKDATWSKNRKEGREPSVDLPVSEGQGSSPYVVSAKPGAVNFVESGVEFSRGETDWQKLTDNSELEPGDRLRTDSYSLAELMVFPDIYLRLDGDSELLLEQLSNESITVKVLHGSIILDIARFDRKQLPPITIGGPSTSAVVAHEGNYRVDARPSGDEIVVREGKVIFQERSVGACRKIAAGTVSNCGKKTTDNFDIWSRHRGEGEFMDGTVMATHLARLRRRRFKNTGCWYQPPGQSYYTFVPFSSTYFRSPYGGSYSSVLSPRRTPMPIEPGSKTPTRLPRSVIAPFRP